MGTPVTRDQASMPAGECRVGRVECSYKLRSNWTAAAAADAAGAAPMPRHRRSPSSLPTKEAKTSSMEGRKGNGRGLRSADSEADADDGRVKSGAAHSGGGGSNSVAVVVVGRTVDVAVAVLRSSEPPRLLLVVAGQRAGIRARLRGYSGARLSTRRAPSALFRLRCRPLISLIVLSHLLPGLQIDGVTIHWEDLKQKNGVI